MQQIGIIGMSVMGSNLALNMENHGYHISIFNRSREKTDEIIAKNFKKKLTPYYSIENFVNSLESPRFIILMINAGRGIDEIIKLLKPLLKKGDILIDGGNSFYKDTIYRSYKLAECGLNFIGAGFSGGEEGALKGPAIMPGGPKKAYELISPILKKISANIENEPCVAYIGPDGSGHYVKMIHNGIEYGDMQLISEAYSLMKNILNLNNNHISSIFAKWNQGELKSYLIEITENIFKKKDETGNDLIDFILDEAVDKETGKWASQDALDLGEPLNLISESVFFRYISSLKQQRITASKILSGPKISTFKDNKIEFIEKIRRSVYFGKIISYAQGFSQLKAASNRNRWHINYVAILKIFRAGCIIRAELLKKIIDVYMENMTIDNLLLASYFKKITAEYQQSLRDVVICALQYGIPTPALSAAIIYYDSYRSAVLPANLIQAQRDYFGAHTYKRIDKDGTFHTKWL